MPSIRRGCDCLAFVALPRLEEGNRTGAAGTAATEKGNYQQDQAKDAQCMCRFYTRWIEVIVHADSMDRRLSFDAVYKYSKSIDDTPDAKTT